MSKSKFILRLAMTLSASALLLASLRLPLWHMRMEAPQYRDQEALKVVVLPGALRGDLNEIKVLNKYIGVTVPDTLPQTHWLPLALSIAAGLGLVVAFLPARTRRLAAFALAVALCVGMLTAAGQAQLQMYRIGHDRNRHAALTGIADFTPPLLGNRKLAQFELESRLGIGSLAIGIAAALYAATGLAAREKKAGVRRFDKSDTFVAAHPQISDYAI
jgi:hypothetical protein